MLYRKEVSMHPSNVHVHPFFSISPLLAPVGVLSSGDDGTKFYTVYCKYISEVTDGDMLWHVFSTEQDTGVLVRCEAVMASWLES